MNLAHNALRRTEASKSVKFSLKDTNEIEEEVEVKGIGDLDGVEVVDDFAGLEGIPGLGGLNDPQPIMNDMEGIENGNI